MSNILIVDRIEGEFAVCEDESLVFHNILLSRLPVGVREGDCLRQTGDGYVIDKEEAARRRALNKRLFDQLKKPKP